jgi:adenylate cyclase
MQDRIVATIAAQLSQRLDVDIVTKAQRKPPANLAAYEFLLRGIALPNGDPKVEEEARNFFRQAIERDPNYARAYAFLGEYTMLVWMRDLAAPRSLLDRAIELTGKALELDGHDPDCHASHGHVRKDLDLAEHHYLMSLSLNPNHPAVTAGLGIVYGYLGDAKRGIALFERARELDPHFNPSWYWRDKGTILFMARRYEEAIACLKRSPMALDFVEAHLAACHAYLGNMELAHHHTAATLRITPGFTIAQCRDIEPFRFSEDADHQAEGFRLAGLPE